MPELFENSSVHLRSVFENATDGIILINSRGIMIEINPSALSLFGYEKNELLGQKVNILMPMPHSRDHDKYMMNYFKSNIPKIIGIGREINGLRKDGTQFPFRLAVSEFRDGGERYFTGLIHDLTREKLIEQNLKNYTEELELRVAERTKELLESNQNLKTEIDVRQAAEFALRESQRIYKLIAQNFPNGTINVFDRDLNYIFVEGKELSEAGFSTDQLIGTNFIDRLDEEVKEDVRNELLSVFDSKPAEFEVKVNDNVHLLRAEPLTSATGKIHQILVVETNITQRRKAEEEMKLALKKEQDLNKMKSAFVSMASHEFRTPLSAILSSATLIGKYTKEEQQVNREKHVNKVKSNVKNLNNILDDFLSLEKLNLGVMNAHEEPLDLIGFIKEFIEDIKGILKSSQSIILETTEDKLEIFSDPMLLQNILNNLVSNASKYSSEDAPIIFRISIVNDKIAVSVVDQGIGIPDNDKPEMFNRFFRASNAFNIGGTGLGLNIVQNYLKLLKGDITFESELDKGSTFTFTIPFNQKLRDSK